MFWAALQNSYRGQTTHVRIRVFSIPGYSSCSQRVLHVHQCRSKTWHMQVQLRIPLERICTSNNGQVLPFSNSSWETLQLPE